MNARKTYVAPELELFEVRSEERFTAAGCEWTSPSFGYSSPCEIPEGIWTGFDGNSGGSF